MRLPAVVLALAVAGCTHQARPAAPYVPPVAFESHAPSGVYVTTAAVGSDPLAEPPVVRYQVPTLHGLAPDALRRANAGLDAAVDAARWDPREELYGYGDDGDLARIWVEGALAAVTARYVTVDLVVTTDHRERGAFYDVEPYVVDRATGARVTLGTLLRAAGVPVLAAYVNHRLPRPVPATRDALHRVTPTTAGLRVAVPGWAVGRPHDDPLAVVVPWPVLAPYLR